MNGFGRRYDSVCVGLWKTCQNEVVCRYKKLGRRFVAIAPDTISAVNFSLRSTHGQTPPVQDSRASRTQTASINRRPESMNQSYHSVRCKPKSFCSRTYRPATLYCRVQAENLGRSILA